MTRLVWLSRGRKAHAFWDYEFSRTKAEHITESLCGQANQAHESWSAATPDTKRCALCERRATRYAPEVRD